jgi:hypothetical protein
MTNIASEVSRRLARNAEAVCRHYLSKGRRAGRYWIIGDVQNTPGRSLYVRLSGPDYGPGAAGHWVDVATSEHGDLLDLIARNRDYYCLGDAIEDARLFLSLPHPPIPGVRAPDRQLPADRPKPPGACSMPPAPLPAPRPKPICAPAASRRRSIGRHCAITPRPTTAATSTPRLRCGPPCLRR